MENDSQQTARGSTIPTPAELKGKNLGTVTTQGGKSVSSEGVIPSPDSALNKTALDDSHKYGALVHSYIREYISAADRKASFVFTIGAALLVYLYEKGIVVSWLKSPNTWALGEILAFIAISGLSISCLLAVAVVFPKLKGSRRGFIFWESIAEFESASSFSDAAQQLSGPSLTNELLKHVYEIAHVCKEKYRILNWSLRIGAIGAISTILYLIKG